MEDMACYKNYPGKPVNIKVRQCKMKSWNWTNFDPKVTKTDKRDRDGAVAKAEKFVETNLNELALCSFTAIPIA